VTGRHGDPVPLDPETDYDTGAYFAGYAAREAEAAGTVRGHARPRAPRSGILARLRRRNTPAPAVEAEDPLTASRLLDLADISEPGEFTQAVNRYAEVSPALPPEAFARPAAQEPRENEAAARILTERADLARMYAPAAVPATPWGAWDGPENREPLAPYRWDHRADFRDLPLFRSTVRAACKAGLRALGTRGVHPIPPPPDYELDRFTVEPDGIDLGPEFDLIEARAGNGFYRASRMFHSADAAGFKRVAA